MCHNPVCLLKMFSFLCFDFIFSDYDIWQKKSFFPLLATKKNKKQNPISTWTYSSDSARAYRDVAAFNDIFMSTMRLLPLVQRVTGLRLPFHFKITKELIFNHWEEWLLFRGWSDSINMYANDATSVGMYLLYYIMGFWFDFLLLSRVPSARLSGFLSVFITASESLLWITDTMSIQD